MAQRFRVPALLSGVAACVLSAACPALAASPRPSIEFGAGTADSIGNLGRSTDSLAPPPLPPTLRAPPPPAGLPGAPPRYDVVPPLGALPPAPPRYDVVPPLGAAPPVPPRYDVVPPLGAAAPSVPPRYDVVPNSPGRPGYDAPDSPLGASSGQLAAPPAGGPYQNLALRPPGQSYQDLQLRPPGQSYQDLPLRPPGQSYQELPLRPPGSGSQSIPAESANPAYARPPAQPNAAGVAPGPAGQPYQDLALRPPGQSYQDLPLRPPGQSYQELPLRPPGPGSQSSPSGSANPIYGGPPLAQPNGGGFAPGPVGQPYQDLALRPPGPAAPPSGNALVPPFGGVRPDANPAQPAAANDGRANYVGAPRQPTGEPNAVPASGPVYQELALRPPGPSAPNGGAADAQPDLRALMEQRRRQMNPDGDSASALPIGAVRPGDPVPIPAAQAPGRPAGVPADFVPARRPNGQIVWLPPANAARQGDGYQNLPANAGRQGDGYQNLPADAGRPAGVPADFVPARQPNGQVVGLPPANVARQGDGYQNLPANAGRQGDGYQNLPANAGRQGDGYQNLPANAGRQGDGYQNLPANAGRQGDGYQNLPANAGRQGDGYQNLPANAGRQGDGYQNLPANAGQQLAGYQNLPIFVGYNQASPPTRPNRARTVAVGGGLLVTGAAVGAGITAAAFLVPREDPTSGPQQTPGGDNGPGTSADACQPRTQTASAVQSGQPTNTAGTVGMLVRNNRQSTVSVFDLGRKSLVGTIRPGGSLQLEGVPGKRLAFGDQPDFETAKASEFRLVYDSELELLAGANAQKGFVSLTVVNGRDSENYARLAQFTGRQLAAYNAVGGELQAGTIGLQAPGATQRYTYPANSAFAYSGPNANAPELTLRYDAKLTLKRAAVSAAQPKVCP